MNVSREDSLLNKLKNCVGSIAKEKTRLEANHQPTHNYQHLKQNYHANNVASVPNKNYSLLPNYSTNVPEETWKSRQPLNNYNVAVPPRRNSVIATSYTQTKKPDFEQNMKKYLNNEDQLPISTRRYQYGLKRNQVQDQPLQKEAPREVRTPMMKENQFASQMPRERQVNIQANSYQPDLRGQISKRYNMAQQERPNNQYATQYEQPVNKNALVSRTYQQQVLQRKQILQNDVSVSMPEKRTMSARKEYTSGLNSIRKQPVLPHREHISVININSTRKQPTLPQRQQQKIAVKEQVTIRKEKGSGRVVVVGQQMLKVCQSQRKGQCSALLKLKKISELNQKINERIRNIINVFQEHKC